MHTENMEYQLSFREDSLCVSVVATGNFTHISYSDFFKIIKTKNLYLMKTKAEIHVIVEKNH